MKPIYFPYTFVPAEIAEAGAACFDQLIVCQPSGLEVSGQMTESVKNGLLDIHVPVKGDEEKILSVLKDYERWADVHTDSSGIHLALPKHQKNQAPFFNESSIMKIKEDIQRKLNKTDKAQSEADPIFAARIFLHIAHEFDMQNHDINRSIRKLDLMEHELMQNLQGEEAVFDKNDAAELTLSAKGVSRVNDPFDFMISERVEAWSGLMFHQLELNEMPSIFVTSNRSVFTYMIENSPSGEMVLNVENIPIEKDSTEEMQGWRNSLMKNIQKYARDPWPVTKGEMIDVPVKKSAGRKTSLSVYIVPGVNLLDFLSRFYPHAPDDSYSKKNDRKIANTLLGFFEIQP